MPTIRTLARPLRHEPAKTRGSRFIASVEPIAMPEAAMAVVEACREELSGATHHPFAWRCGTGRDLMRYGDDGEPSGTAGKPILQEIDGRRLTDVAVVVTRYFGGTRLGTGGLIRAYSGAASAALDLAEIVESPIFESLALTYAYDVSGAVQGVLAGFGLTPVRADYGARVEVEVEIPVEDTEQLTRALRDATRGRIDIGGGAG